MKTQFLLSLTIKAHGDCVRLHKQKASEIIWFHRFYLNFLLHWAADDLKQKSKCSGEDEQGEATNSLNDEKDWLFGVLAALVDVYSELLTVESRSKWVTQGLLQQLDLIDDPNPALNLLAQQLRKHSMQEVSAMSTSAYTVSPSAAVSPGPSTSYTTAKLFSHTPHLGRIASGLLRLKDLVPLDEEDITESVKKNNDSAEDPSEQILSLVNEMKLKLLKRLLLIDPMHRGRYHSASWRLKQ